METPPSRPRRSSKVNLVITKKLGSGKFEVFHTRMFPNNNEYALKSFPKDQASQEVYERENAFLSKLNHVNIIRHCPIKNFIADNTNYSYILTEYAPYETFYNLVTNKGLTNDKIIRTYFHQLIEGLEYLHSQDIAHLDLKLENLLLGNDFILKIADFDQSQNSRDKELLFFGTPCYRAPEVLNNSCQEFFAADVYACGVLLFIFKAGCFPFMESEDGATKSLLHYDLFVEDNKEFWLEKVIERTNKNFFDDAFKELVNGMLAESPEKRWTIEEIRKSAWFNGPTFSKEELKIEMSKIWEKLDYKKYLKKSCQL